MGEHFVRGTNRPSQWATDPCPYCGKLFVQGTGMTLHKRTMHADTSRPLSEFNCPSRKKGLTSRTDRETSGD